MQDWKNFLGNHVKIVTSIIRNKYVYFHDERKIIANHIEYALQVPFFPTCQLTFRKSHIV